MEQKITRGYFWFGDSSYEVRAFEVSSFEVSSFEVRAFEVSSFEVQLPIENLDILIHAHKDILGRFFPLNN